MTDVPRTGGGDGDRSAVLLVRVWSEHGAHVLRGRLTSRSTSPGGPVAQETTVALAASPEDVVDAVRAWLTGFLGDPPGPGDGDWSAAGR